MNDREEGSVIVVVGERPQEVDPNPGASGGIPSHWYSPGSSSGGPSGGYSNANGDSITD
jgi:hypothetical protein